MYRVGVDSIIVELPGVILVGTAHVSEKSVEEVREAIATYDPDVVAVELDASRLDAIMDKRKFEETPITEMLKGGKSFFILAQTLLSSFQRRLGEEMGVEPGAEMKAAVEEAQARDKPLVLADRDIGVTLKRAWTRMGFREKSRVGWELFKALFGYEDEDEMHVDDMLEEDVLTAMMEELATFAPSVSEVLVSERDAYLAKRIHEAKDQGTVLAVVGAGHLKGIQRHLEDPTGLPDLDALEEVPERRFSWGKVVMSGLVLVVLSIFATLAWNAYTTGDYGTLINNLLYWTLINGTLSAVGAAVAGGHPLSVATAFLAAPITSLHPALAAGWFAGAMEAHRRKPTVADFQAVSQMETFKDFRTNRLTRVLLVTALANVGSVIGTFIGGSVLIKSVLDTLQ